MVIFNKNGKKKVSKFTTIMESYVYICHIEEEEKKRSYASRRIRKKNK